jgi:glutathione S-transferase
MKLYMHPASPNVRAVRVVAHLLGIPLATVHVDAMAGEHRTDPYLLMNPNGLFPVLADDDFTLWETVPIMQYLASTKPGTSLWPAGSREQADICRWQCWSLAHWSPALRPYIYENFFKRLKGEGEPDASVIRANEETYHRFARVLDTQLGGHEYLVGSQLTLADISACSYLMYAEVAHIPLERYANIRRWLEGIERLPAWQATIQ